MPLSYPVDLNEKYTYWNTDTNEPLRDGLGRLKTNMNWPTADGFPPPNLNPKIVLVLEVKDPTPVDKVDYDAATQNISRDDPVIDLGAETYTWSWTISAKTAQEITDYADNQDRNNGKTFVTAAVDWLGNRASALDNAADATDLASCITLLNNIKGDMPTFMSGVRSLIRLGRDDI